MNKKAIYLAILFGLIFSFLIPISFAYQYKSDDILAGTDISILNTLNNILMYPVNLPGFKPLGIPGTGNQGVPLWILVTVFALIYSVLFYGVDNVGLFKDPKMRGAKITFTISLSLLFIFGTTLIPRFWQVLTATVGLAILLLLIFVGWGSWVVFKKIQANHETLEAEAGKQIAEARKVEADANKLSWEADKDNRLIKAEENNLNELEHKFSNLLSDLKLDEKQLKSLKEIILKLQMVSNTNPAKVHEYIKRLDKVFARLIEDLTKHFNKSESSVLKFKELYSSFRQDAIKAINEFKSKGGLAIGGRIADYYVRLENYVLRDFEQVNNSLFPGGKNRLHELNEEMHRLLVEVRTSVEDGNFSGTIEDLNKVEQLFAEAGKLAESAENAVSKLKTHMENLVKVNQDLRRISNTVKKEAVKEEKGKGENNKIVTSPSSTGKTLNVINGMDYHKPYHPNGLGRK